MKIPIKKHTKVRRPVSRHITLLMDNTYNIPFDLHPTRKLLLVKDIRTDLHYIIDTGNHKNITIRLGKLSPKPSLLTRVKERFKRK